MQLKIWLAKITTDNFFLLVKPLKSVVAYQWLVALLSAVFPFLIWSVKGQSNHISPTQILIK